MNYLSWLETIPAELTGDPLWRNEVYRLAVLLGDLAWHDVSKLYKDRRTLDLSNQLFRAIGSVSSNIAEGYSWRSGKDQARFYEYALGSARESRNWYYLGRHVTGQTVANHRMELLTKIIRLLLVMIPNERGFKMKEDSPEYVADAILLNDFPLPTETHHAPRTMETP